jgi:hypothetical protein
MGHAYGLSIDGPDYNKLLYHPDFLLTDWVVYALPPIAAPSAFRPASVIRSVAISITLPPARMRCGVPVFGDYIDFERSPEQVIAETL